MMLDSLRRAIYHTLKAGWYWLFGEPGRSGRDDVPFVVGMAIFAVIIPVMAIALMLWLITWPFAKLHKFAHRAITPNEVGIPAKFIAIDNEAIVEPDELFRYPDKPFNATGRFDA